MQRRTPQRVSAALVVLAGLLLSPVSAHAALSVEALNRLVADGAVTTGLRYTVEGRFSSLSSSMLRMYGCNVSFRAAEGFTFVRPRGESRTIEISGAFEEEDGKLVFLVTSLTPLQGDVETFRSKLTKIDPTKAAELYELADWAWRRGEFYKDEELFRLARETRTSALMIERAALPADDAEGLLKIADRVTELKLAARLREELLHEACRLLWENSQKKQKPLPATALRRARELLPGAQTPLKDEAPELEKKYNEDPLATYRAADAAQRVVLHRLFYRSAALALILAEAREDAGNGAAIADAIDEEVPEKHALAEEYRDRALDSRLARVGSATRSEMLQLRDDFARRMRDKDAVKTVTDWLANLLAQRRREGPAGLMKAADEYLALLDDRGTAYKLMLEAWNGSGQSDEVRRRFEQMGYELRNGRWLTREEARNVPLTEVEKALREGRVVAGMSTADVRRMMGAPTSVSRVSTFGHVLEIWIYGERNRPRIAVQFTRRTHQKDGEVSSVSRLAPR